MKVRFTKLTNINGEWYNIGDEEEFSDSAAESLITGEHAVEAKEPEKRIPETAVKPVAENAMVEKPAAKKAAVKQPAVKKPAKKVQPRK